MAIHSGSSVVKMHLTGVQQHALGGLVTRAARHHVQKEHPPMSDPLPAVDHAPDTASTFDVGVCFGPTGFWNEVVEATRRAEALGLDSIGFWDHYHSERPEWALLTGWSLYGYLAAITERVRLVPMVLCRPNHLLGVLAKESSMLQIVSNGRFELGIGAGDYDIEFKSWNVPFPDASHRIAWLEESVQVLRRLWNTEQVTMKGEFIELNQACCTPAPPTHPRIVVGVGNSRRLVDSAIAYADELNVYANEKIVTYASERIAISGRPVTLSVFAHRDGEPPDADALVREMTAWRAAGATRYIMTYGWDDDIPREVETLARAKDTLNAPG
jgi:alkanesulfonate monooxygenase SsuD/methylene tetrahydromethanopterin reductase-like flavin-dependent oxidoreductase (luciferase family)